jgi:hypothetical protein
MSRFDKKIRALGTDRSENMMKVCHSDMKASQSKHTRFLWLLFTRAQEMGTG